MPGWLGYDTVNHAYDGSGVSTSCGYANNQLSTYVSAHFSNANNKFFARYFDHGNLGYLYDAPAETGPLSVAGFHFLVPIASPPGYREASAGATGTNYGTVDGTTVCNNIVRAIQAGGMGFPPGGTLYVYLDIEPGTFLTTEYWEAWATAVRQYVTPWTSSPLYPCAYANACTSCDPANAQTMSVLDAHTYDSTSATFCWGLWAQTPTGASCTWCNNSPVPDFSTAQGYDRLTLHYWQHGLTNACVSLGCDGCRPNVDNDSSNPIFNMMDYTLNVY